MVSPLYDDISKIRMVLWNQHVCGFILVYVMPGYSHGRCAESWAKVGPSKNVLKFSGSFIQFFNRIIYRSIYWNFALAMHKRAQKSNKRSSSPPLTSNFVIRQLALKLCDFANRHPQSFNSDCAFPECALVVPVRARLTAGGRQCHHDPLREPLHHQTPDKTCTQIV